MQGTTDPTCVELLDAAALCHHLVPEGSVYAFLADHRSELFPDQLFADLFPSGRGRPSVPAEMVATVMVLQALEGLSDREAAAQLRHSIAWKVACGLSLVDPGFHPTVLTLCEPGCGPLPGINSQPATTSKAAISHGYPGRCDRALLGSG
jgi:hypothetical protein